MNIVRAAFAISLSISCLLSSAFPLGDAPMTEEQLSEYKILGGMVKRPGSHKGRIVYANCQSRVPESVLRSNARAMENDIQYVIEIETGTFDLTTPQLRGDATLFVVDNPTLPTLLMAPEDKWGVVNVTKLTGDNADEMLFLARVRKELSRGLALLCGAFQSQYQNTLMECVTAPQQLDAYKDDRLPFDAIMGIGTYLKGYGMRQFESLSYREACQEGWAPKPTNPVEQKIWDEVHEIPTEPLKITFDPETDKK